jgi:hypothetical protein
MSKTFKTTKGTELALMNLKGKDYLIVANRLLWFVEEVPHYSIETNFLTLTEESCVAHTTLTIFDKDGRATKRVTATKKETKKDFPDFIEKAETGSLGRALAYLGYGTQFAQQDFEEGTRLADAPLAVVAEAPAVAPVVKPSFRKPATKANNALQDGINASGSNHALASNKGVGVTGDASGKGTSSTNSGWE